LSSVAWSRADREQLSARGVGEDEAARQIELLRRPPVYPALDRPCTAGDGIEVLDAKRARKLEALAASAAREGRCEAFVPASGAATRMFQELLACRADAGALDRAWLDAACARGRAEAFALRSFVEGLPQFAFAGALDTALRSRGASLATIAAGPYRPLLDALLDDDGLGYARRAKGLLRFHAAVDGARTAFDEHLIEAGRLWRDAGGASRIHFTVSPEHRRDFEARLDAVRAPLEGLAGARFDVSFSEQKPSSDTLALDDRGEPFRDSEGRLLFRPAGHGALIENLAERNADLVFLKNIDNVAYERFKEPTWHWSAALIGRLVELQSEAREHLAGLARGQAPPAALGFLDRSFAAIPPSGSDPREWAIDRLRRPIRVCGMVENMGEPGGGPFWVRGADGATSPQIVESAQADPGSAEHRELFRRGTHFNPVFMACALRDPEGRPCDLARFVDPSAVILTRKSSEGRALLALERPGLWNGAMARWNTRFVEVPLGVFNPVKTVLDLLRPEHQP
jgi:hypothetical protein